MIGGVPEGGAPRYYTASADVIVFDFSVRIF